jgi:alpha-1,2-mannosyltransferase
VASSGWRLDWRRIWGLRVFADPRFVRLAVWLVLLIALWYRANQVIGWLSAPQWGYDFSAYWLAARHLLHGESIYTAAQLAGPYEPQFQGQFLYLYPPLLAVLVMPLAWLSPGTFGPAMGAWAVLGAAIATVVVLGVGRLEALLVDREHALLLLAAAFAFPPLVAELVLGNVHVVLLGLLALAWWETRAGARRGDAVAGLAVGTAALIKLFPAVVLLWFALTGRWRAVAWAIGGAVALVALTLPITGVGPWLDYPRAILNLGAPADTTDALAPSLWLSAVLPILPARAVVLGLGLLAVAWSAVRLEERASFGVAVAVSVLVAPSVFQHYLAIMVLPLLLGLRVVLAGPTAARLALAASYLAMWPGQQPLLGTFSWVLNRAIPTLGAVGVPATLARWGRPGRSIG